MRDRLSSLSTLSGGPEMTDWKVGPTARLGYSTGCYPTDINRSGLTTGQDILRLIDMLNGAGESHT